MGSELAELGLASVSHHQTPDDSFVQDTGSLNRAGLGHRTEGLSAGDACSCSPQIEPGFDAGRDGDGSNPVQANLEGGSLPHNDGDGSFLTRDPDGGRNSSYLASASAILQVACHLLDC